MVDVRVSAASGTAADWAASTLVLGVGQLAWETDTGILRIGDGQSLEQNLPILAQENSGIVINDVVAQASGNTVWSSLEALTQDQATLTAAKSYTDTAVKGALQGQQPRLDVCLQNTNGTYPNRPNAYCVFVFSTGGSTTPPTWLVPGVDVFFLRS